MLRGICDRMSIPDLYSFPYCSDGTKSVIWHNCGGTKSFQIRLPNDVHWKMLTFCDVYSFPTSLLKTKKCSCNQKKKTGLDPGGTEACSPHPHLAKQQFFKGIFLSRNATRMDHRTNFLNIFRMWGVSTPPQSPMITCKSVPPPPPTPLGNPGSDPEFPVPHFK